MFCRLAPALGLAVLLLAGCAPLTPTDPAGPSNLADPTPSGAGAIGTATAEPSEIPLAALLTGEDVGPGYTAEEWLQGDDHGSIGMMLAYCGVVDFSEASDHTISQRRVSAAIPLGDGVTPEQYVLETVTRYEPGWAQQYVDDLAATQPDCTDIPVMGSSDDIATWTIVGADFAGDRSLLIHEERPGGTQFHAVVRQGDVVAELRIHTGDHEGQARSIVEVAAQRLCAAHSC